MMLETGPWNRRLFFEKVALPLKVSLRVERRAEASTPHMYDK